jgi:hypothetical protein
MSHRDGLVAIEPSPAGARSRPAPERAGPGSVVALMVKAGLAVGLRIERALELPFWSHEGFSWRRHPSGRPRWIEGWMRLKVSRPGRISTETCFRFMSRISSPR